MGYVDFLLNLAGLLLWMKWRSLPFDPFNKRTPATLVGTLRRAAPSYFRRWHVLAGIALLLVLRALFYRLIGPAMHWTGQLDLGVISLSFRSDLFDRMLLFSVFSFCLALGVFYLWLLLLSLLAGHAGKSEPVHRLVRMQLGMMDGWPRWAKIISPLAVTTLLWWLASWVLAGLGLIPNPVSAAQRIEGSIVIGLGSYLTWKFIIAAVLVGHLLNTYIYFGKHPVWNYVNGTAKNFLAPFRKLPLRVGRVDFAPVAGIAVVFFAAELWQRALIWIYARLPL